MRSHPHASDTLAGICDWWISPALCPTPRDVEAALDELVADGVLQRTRLIDNSEVYSVRRDKATEPDASRLMYQAVIATSKTLRETVDAAIHADPILFAPTSPFHARGMTVRLNTPFEMQDQNHEGVSLWLYRIMRDEARLNDPPTQTNAVDDQAAAAAATAAVPGDTHHESGQ